MIQLASANTWTIDTPCSQTDPEIFSPDGNGQAIRNQRITAEKICATCPLESVTQCAKRALESDEYYGVWAGVYISVRPADREIARARLKVIAAGKAGVAA